MFPVLFLQFVKFPSRKDSLLYGNKDAVVSASGSIGLYVKGKCIQTFPNQTLEADEDTEWCSNIARGSSDKPWITYSLRNRKMKVSSFAIRNGCCLHDCCCFDDNDLIDGVCCCRLYSFSLQGSNDNVTWTVLHIVDKDQYIRRCETKMYELNTKESYQYIRIVEEEPLPGCKFCMQINQIELYGDSYEMLDYQTEDNDESVSIIGKVRKDNE